MEVLMKEETQTLKDLIESAGFEARSYSGRGMFGEQCLAFTIERGVTESNAWADLVNETAGGLEEIEVLTQAMRNARSDDMGLGRVIYFPLFEYAEEDEPCETCAELKAQGVERGSCPECGDQVGPLLAR